MSGLEAGKSGKDGGLVPAIRAMTSEGKEEDGWADVEKGPSFRLGQ